MMPLGRSGQTESGAKLERLTRDVSTTQGMAKTMADFAKTLSKMNRELLEKEKKHELFPGQAEAITASYAESFIYAAVRTVEKARAAQRNR